MFPNYIDFLSKLQILIIPVERIEILCKSFILLDQYSNRSISQRHNFCSPSRKIDFIAQHRRSIYTQAASAVNTELISASHKFKCRCAHLVLVPCDRTIFGTSLTEVPPKKLRLLSETILRALVFPLPFRRMKLSLDLEWMIRVDAFFFFFLSEAFAHTHTRESGTSLRIRHRFYGRLRERSVNVHLPGKLADTSIWERGKIHGLLRAVAHKPPAENNTRYKFQSLCSLSFTFFSKLSIALSSVNYFHIFLLVFLQSHSCTDTCIKYSRLPRIDKKGFITYRRGKNASKKR